MEQAVKRVNNLKGECSWLGTFLEVYVQPSGLEPVMVTSNPPRILESLKSSKYLNLKKHKYNHTLTIIHEIAICTLVRQCTCFQWTLLRSEVHINSCW